MHYRQRFLRCLEKKEVFFFNTTSSYTFELTQQDHNCSCHFASPGPRPAAAARGGQGPWAGAVGRPNRRESGCQGVTVSPQRVPASFPAGQRRGRRRAPAPPRQHRDPPPRPGGVAARRQPPRSPRWGAVRRLGSSSRRGFCADAAGGV